MHCWFCNSGSESSSSVSVSSWLWGLGLVVSGVLSGVLFCITTQNSIPATKDAAIIKIDAIKNPMNIRPVFAGHVSDAGFIGFIGVGALGVGIPPKVRALVLKIYSGLHPAVLTPRMANWQSVDTRTSRVVDCKIRKSFSN